MPEISSEFLLKNGFSIFTFHSKNYYVIAKADMSVSFDESRTICHFWDNGHLDIFSDYACVQDALKHFNIKF